MQVGPETLKRALLNLSRATWKHHEAGQAAHARERTLVPTLRTSGGGRLLAVSSICRM